MNGNEVNWANSHNYRKYYEIISNIYALLRQAKFCLIKNRKLKEDIFR